GCEDKKMPILAVSSAKGGVGKTTVSTHLASAFALFGARTLLIDLDPQGAAGALLQVDDFAPQLSSTSQIRSAEMLQTLSFDEIPELEIVPADPEIDHLQHHFAPGRMQELLKKHERTLDFVVFDLPPVLEPVTLWALGEADAVLVVVKPTALSVRTLPSLLNKILENQKTRLEGILLNQIEDNNFSIKTVEMLHASFGRWIFPVTVPFDPTVQESALFGQSLFSRNAYAPSAQAYQNIARELLFRYDFSYLL
ncbi:MAG: ParA family protein, partial [Myxococcota bacterium]